MLTNQCNLTIPKSLKNPRHKMQLCINELRACLVDMKTSVNDYPSDEEASRTGEKSFLGQLPGPTIFCFINTLINERQSKSLFGPMVAITE